MPNNFSSRHANAIILYGQHTSQKFEALVTYWNTLIGEDDWTQFRFICIDSCPQAPKLPQELQAKVKDSVWLMQMETLQNLGRPEELIQALHGMIENNNVLIQCVFMDFDELSVPPEPIVKWLKSIQQAFPLGFAEIIPYLLMTNQGKAYVQQRDYTKAIQESRNTFSSVYFLGTNAEDNAAIGEVDRWHAVCGELLANSGGYRMLSNDSLYSLGLSMLNARGSELTSIREVMTIRWIKEHYLGNAIPMQNAWEWVIRSAKPFPGMASASLRPALISWLEALIAQQVSLPGQQECENNRILGKVCQRSPREIQQWIDRFFHLNCGTPENRRTQANDFTKTYSLTILDTLRKTYNANCFPQELLHRICEELKEIAAKEPALQLPVWQQRSAILPTRQKVYCNEFCTDTEKELRQYYLQQYVRLYAEAFRVSLMQVSRFIDNAKTLPLMLDKATTYQGQFQGLSEKYEHYIDEVNETILQHTREIVVVPNKQVYYSPDGEPLFDFWRALIQATADRLNRYLPPQWSGSFCETISWEYRGQDGLNKFFARYLVRSKRMLHEVLDNFSTPQPLYYCDHAFANHPWFNRPQITGVTVHTDNVERIDLFTLDKEMDWYLENSSLFKQQHTGPDGESGLVKAFCGNHETTAGTHLPADAAQSGVETKDEEDEPSDSQDNSHRLRLQKSQNRYILTWEWDLSETNAIVEIEQGNRMIHSRCYTQTEYMEPKYGLPQGVDVSVGLPTGPVQVRIISTAHVFASHTLSGRKNNVIYHFDRTGKTGVKLTVTGKADDIMQVALYARMHDSDPYPILYPLYPKGNDVLQKYSDLDFGARKLCKLEPYPDDRYPKVETKET